MKKVVKIILYSLGGIIALILLVVILLMTPWGKSIVRNQITSFLNTKLNNNIAIGKIDYSIPNSVALEQVLIYDLQKDTLLWVDTLHLDINMLALLKNKISVDNIKLDGVNAYMHRTIPDTVFNYQYIIDAFASKGGNEVVTANEEANQKDGSGLIIDLVQANLKNIRFRFHDESGGTDFALQLNELLLRPDIIDLDIMDFSIDEFAVNGLKTSLVLTESILPPAPTDTSEGADFKLKVAALDLNNISFVMENKPDPMYIKLDLGNLKGDVPLFDLKQQLIEVNKLMLQNTNTLMVMGGNKSVPTKIESKEEIIAQSASSTGWRIQVKDIALKQIDYILDNKDAPRQPDVVDYAHLNVSDMMLLASDVLYTSDTISGILKQLALKEHSGLIVQDFRTHFLYHSRGAALEKLYLKTPGTELKDRIAIAYPSIDRLSDELEKLKLNIALQKSTISVNDVLLFMPVEQHATFLPYTNKQLQITAELKGMLNAIEIKDLYLAGLDNTIIHADGVLNGLPDPEKMQYTLNLKEVSTTILDLKPFMPDSLLSGFNMPEYVSVNGEISGGLYNYMPNLNINTSLGDLRITGMLNLKPEGAENYDLNIITNNLNVGNFLKMDSTIGNVSAELSFAGKSFDINTMEANYKFKINNAELLQYNYNKLSGYGNIHNKTASLNAVSFDPNLNFNITASADLNGAHPAIKAKMPIKNIDLLALKLSEEKLNIGGVFHIDFPILNPDYPFGSLYIDDAELTLPKIKLPLDSIYIVAESTPLEGQNIIGDIAGILNFDVTGKLPLTQIGNAALSHIDYHYNINDTLEPISQPYSFHVNASVNYHPIIQRFNSSIKPFRQMNLEASMSNDKMNFDFYAPNFVYNDSKIDSAHVFVAANKDTMRYGVGFIQFEQSNFLKMFETSVSGRLRKDSLYVRFNSKDSVDKNRFTLGGAIYHDLNNDTAATYVRMFKGIRFNYNSWDVAPSNKIVIAPEGFFVSNLNIHYNDQSIKINSETETPNSPLDVIINNFSLANITSIFSGDTLIADGQLNAEIALEMQEQFPHVYADVNIENLEAFTNKLGTLNIVASNKGIDQYRANLSLLGFGNNILLNGNYNAKPINGNELDFKLNIEPINLASMQGLTFGALKNSSGLLKGDLSLKGTIARPLVYGTLSTDELATTVSMLNGYFKMPNEQIVFDGGKISFNHFNVEDKNRNKITVNGNVTTRNYKTYRLNLDVNANKWQPLNSTDRDYKGFFGKLFVSTGLKITGSATAPNISGNLTIHEDTDLTIKLLDEDPEIMESEGIVSFYDSRIPPEIEETGTDTFTKARRFRMSRATQMNVNVIVEEDAKFSVVIDPNTGDNITVQGAAALNAQIEPNGSIGLTGNYEIKEGYYELSFPPVRRKFKIQKGSSVSLVGDPLASEVNITAIYAANIPPYDLVENQVSDPAQLVYYKQRLPFEILLKLNGQVLKPDIKFDIAIPEEKATAVSADVSNTVQAKLNTMRNNASDINKQVFAVLVLGRFIADDPFSSNASSNVESIARQSVSRFLSNQLNKIAGQYITGLELNMDLETSEDYTTASKVNRTDLSISASKNLFNDRFSITVGNDFMLEGQQAQRQQSSFIPGNLSANYRITPDGRYQLRAYRKNELQNIIDGYVVETGLGFRFTAEYNKFRYLFMSREKIREYVRKQRLKEEEEYNKKNGTTNDNKTENG